MTVPAWLNATPVPRDEIWLARSTLASGWRSSSSLRVARGGGRMGKGGFGCRSAPASRANKSPARHWAGASIHGFRAQAPRRETAWRCPGKGFARSHLRSAPPASRYVGDVGDSEVERAGVRADHTVLLLSRAGSIRSRDPASRVTRVKEKKKKKYASRSSTDKFPSGSGVASHQVFPDVLPDERWLAFADAYTSSECFATPFSFSGRFFGANPPRNPVSEIRALSCARIVQSSRIHAEKIAG